MSTGGVTQNTLKLKWSFRSKHCVLQVFCGKRPAILATGGNVDSESRLDHVSFEAMNVQT